MEDRNVPSMVLIEVLELVVDMYGAFHWLRYLKDGMLSHLHVIISSTVVVPPFCKCL
jgi:hypothetical protein